MTRAVSPSRPIWAFVTFLALAVVQAWPLPSLLTTHLLGPVSSDAGVYVWNAWVFRDEIIRGDGTPFSTNRVFALDAESDLSQHNYAVATSLITLPLQTWLGVVGAFNVAYLINVALAGFGMYLLARRVCGPGPEAWIAGLLFAWSPFISARATIHPSLIAAAPLPLFTYWLDRAWVSQRVRDVVACGLCVAWAGFSDPYYAVYCLLIAGLYAAVRLTSRQPRLVATGGSRRHRLLDVTTGCFAVLVVVAAAAGRTMYTPVLLLTTAVAARWVVAKRERVSLVTRAPWRRIAFLTLVAVIAAAIPLAPILTGMIRRQVSGRFVEAPVYWRSSAPGLDLSTYVLPNPMHPRAEALARHLEVREGGLAEQVGSLSWVGLFIIVAAVRRASFRPPRLWWTMGVAFAWMSLGPFVHVFDFNTYVPTPWTLLRYVPVVGAARMPTRLAVVVAMVFAMIVALALKALAERYPQWRHRLAAIVAVLACLELLPAPRPVYSAEAPDIYQTIAADPRDVRVLELPFGIRDGLSSLGNGSAESQFFQTTHGKDLIGGYLSRVSEQRKSFYRQHRFLSPLLTMSAGARPADDVLEMARNAASEFAAAARLGYVVIDTARTPRELQAFAIDALGLRLVGSSGDRRLYVPNGIDRSRAAARISPVSMRAREEH